ncbi:UDP-N-acetylmuramate dehydrogenase [Vreelandella songnenensis]|uniref:UDP-N-acetylenolpyruvoylglucosamine reductase n=1 Tax=Vreelandella songnenensis TaxID=1176243 RepID=A0A2T0V7Q7_9GAMM|nr:UDP-N-acetylmuramate dehydrogenase [Halomonas songnenensis]PRY66088.1 UDP-N-acetylmuramate dehydrogenase [Halomonas songnenensis]
MKAFDFQGTPLIKTHADLSAANTLRLPCIAARYAEPATLGALRQILGEASRQQWPITLLGGGSNVLLPPALNGLALRPRLRQLWLTREGDEVLVHVGAGVNWHALVQDVAARGLWGIENLALIPGDCGAAPVQNIGAYGVELSDSLCAVQVMELNTGKVRWLNQADCAFGYRDSVFKRELSGRVVITRLVLRLSRQPTPKLHYGDLAARLSKTPTPMDVARAVSAIRQEKLPDPDLLANAGSFFKNPLVPDQQAHALLSRYPAMPNFPQGSGQTKLAAGWLIDQCGLKGVQEGAFGVHDRQALVLVHQGGGNREGLLHFAERIVEQVRERFGVVLEPEPRIIQP